MRARGIVKAHSGYRIRLSLIRIHGQYCKSLSRFEILAKSPKESKRQSRATVAMRGSCAQIRTLTYARGPLLDMSRNSAGSDCFFLVLRKVATARGNKSKARIRIIPDCLVWQSSIVLDNKLLGVADDTVVYARSWMWRVVGGL